MATSGTHGRRCCATQPGSAVLDSATLVAAGSPTSPEFKARYLHLAGLPRRTRTRFRLTREEVDLDGARPLVAEGELSEYDLYGEQLEWGYALPAMYRALAAPSAHHEMPPPPRPNSPLFAACIYWAPLLHLMLYSLGWANPGRGLRWWYDAGKPALDPHLALVQQLWEGDGQLDLFAAWLWSGPLSESRALGPIGAPATDAPVLVPHAEWFAGQHETARALRTPNPLSGGADPLHLSNHRAGPLQGPPSPASVVRGGECTVVTMRSMVGWYRALHEAELNLNLEEGPGATDRTVEVHVDTVGRIGTFGQSPVTRRWHATAEAIHLAGR